MSGRTKYEQNTRLVWHPETLCPHRRCSDDAHLVLAGEHLAPAERPYAWLGSLKASEAAAALVARLGDDAPPALTRLQVRPGPRILGSACKNNTIQSGRTLHCCSCSFAPADAYRSTAALSILLCATRQKPLRLCCSSMEVLQPAPHSTVTPPVQASLVEQERVLDGAHAELLAAMRTRAATAAAAAALGGGRDGGGGPSADDCRRVDALRELMLHPDRCGQSCDLGEWARGLRLTVCVHLLRGLLGSLMTQCSHGLLPGM
jgi:hypothetical protein